MPNPDATDTTPFKSGFIAIAGSPNVGKSTLLNRILGQKISITASKPQTTRNRILGVAHRPQAQFIFMDTPGIHRTQKLLNRRIVETALAAIGDADLILMLIDVAHPDPDAERMLTQQLKAQKKPVILALNKIDLIPKAALLDMIQQWSQIYPFEALVPISATEGTQLEDLLDAMQEALPMGPPYFPPDSLTDLPERFLAAEIIREKVIRLTGEEIPYAIAVTVDRYAEDPNKALLRISANIHVERDSQKGIIIGKQGRKLKQIGMAARKAIERLHGTKVFLELFVKVQKNWRKDTRALRRFGY
jgi:GTP-binding protein Era